MNEQRLAPSPSSSASGAAVHLRWPAERFYWAVLEAPGWRRAGVLPAGLLASLEDELPLAVTLLHAVGTPLGNDDHLLVCAARRSDLDRLDPNVLSLRPDGVPAAIQARGGEVGEGLSPTANRQVPCIEDADQSPITMNRSEKQLLLASTASIRGDTDLNLLVGPYEPRPFKRIRRIRHMVGMVAVAMLSGLVVVGLFRREQVWTEQVRSAEQASRALAQQVQPGSSPAELATVVDRLRALAAAADRARPGADPVITLSNVLRSWPTTLDERAVPQSVMISDTTASISLTLRNDPAKFLRGFSAPDGWRLDEPRMNTIEGLTRVSLNMRPLPSEKAVIPLGKGVHP